MAKRTSGIQKMIVVGRLSKDPDIRFYGDDKCKVTLTIPTSEEWPDNEKSREHTEWHEIVLWNKRAEEAGNILKKGCQIYVEGKIRTSHWTDDNNIKRSNKSIVIDDDGCWQILHNPARKDNSNAP